MSLFGKEWTLDSGRSLFSSAFQPATETRHYEQVGDGYKLTVSGMHNGHPYEWGYTAQYDGSDHPVYGRADVDAIEAYRINDLITIGFFKKAGVLGGAYARFVGEDDKSLTVQASGKQEDGTVYYDVIIYKAPEA
jgi:hypothetical protein